MIATLAALFSCLLVPPDREYLSYFDFRTLSLLYCLMVVISGFQQAGLFSRMAHTFCRKAASIRRIGLVLVLLCFFSSMLITNDVALLTFVPFSMIILGGTDQRTDLIHIIVLQTVAANLGSMLTPVGNPQNLFLYSFYNLSIREFLLTMLPFYTLSLIIISGACFLLSNKPNQFNIGKAPEIQKGSLWLCSVLFVICLLDVVRLLAWPWMLALVFLFLLFFNRRLLIDADFMLLLTFVAFFVFAGNLARVDVMADLIRQILNGREYLTALLVSQIISNVPAALLIADFTNQIHPLLLAVNIGGLGTPVASLASLISMKLYIRSDQARSGRFLLEFTVVNAVLLLILSFSVFGLGERYESLIL